MPRTRFAKFTLTHEPAIQAMLFEERARALERGLAIIEGLLAQAEAEGSPASAEERQHLLEKRQETELMLRRAQKAVHRRQRETRRSTP